MPKAQISIPFIVLRPQADGSYRPRYVPGPRHRNLGFRGEDLRHGDGRWFSLEECLAWSKSREADARQRAAVQPGKPRPRLGFLSLADLFDRWFETPRMSGRDVVEGRKERRPLSGSTVKYYAAGRNRLQEFDEGRLWLQPAGAITPRVVAGVLHRIEVGKGLHVARCVRATLSAAYGWAVAANLVPSNPVTGGDFDMPMPAPRIRFGSIDEMRQLVAAADAIGLPEIGDAIMLGLWTGQRQADRLALTDYQRSGDGILFRQAKKHGQPLLIPEAPELARRLEAARTRRAGWRVNYPHVLLDEARQRPFSYRRRYSELFSQVRDAAVAGVPDQLEPMKSLSDFRDQDLRDTAVTWLALAGCTKPMIASITGHSLKTIDETLKHYLGLHPELARSAIGKLVTWYEAATQGEGA